MCSVVGCDGMSSVKGSVSHYLPATGQEFTVNSFNTENCTADTNNTGEAERGGGGAHHFEDGLSPELLCVIRELRHKSLCSCANLRMSFLE